MRRLPFASLTPRPAESGAALWRRTTALLAASVAFATIAGATATFALGTFVLPLPDIDEPGDARITSVAVLAGYLLVSIPLGTWWMARRARPVRRWVVAERSPTTEERRLALRIPRRVVSINAVLWALAAVVFGALNATWSAELGGRIATLIAAGGVITCAIVYLLSERQLRPVAARALAGEIGERQLGPGIRTRSFTAWAVGTGVPMAALMLTAASTLIEADFTARELALTVLVAAGIGAAAALVITMLSAQAISDPVAGLRAAVRRVEEGDLDAEVAVYDGSEIGQLQAGFNRMVSGLRERERIQDLFGRHVGEDVARAALAGGVEMGGETRTVSVLFTDLVGSTHLAATRPAPEVVELLNAFFAVVVESVHSHGGSVNKFEGDAALAIFGAPIPLRDNASSALACARELARRLPAEVPKVEAAIGASAGEVVAGNIGDERRFEYTVIGDPVNEAARLTELAKERPEHVLASESILARASDREAECWRLDGSVTLRGRARETGLAVPA